MITLLTQICRKITAEGSFNPDKYVRTYLDNAEALNKQLGLSKGVKTEIYLQDLDTQMNWIKFSLIFSDFTSLLPIYGNRARIIIPQKDDPHYIDKISISDNLAEMIENCSSICCGYWMHEEEELAELIRVVEPLVDAGRVIVRPSPIVLVFNKPSENAEGRWEMLNADPNSPQGNFLLHDQDKQESIPIKYGKTDSEIERKIFDISIPYIEGVSFSELLKIVNDEQDNITSFRKGIKSLINEAIDNNADMQEVFNDFVRPETDRLNKRFRAITNIHGLRIAGASVSTAAMSLFALNTSGWVSGLANLMGAGGIGLITNEVSEYIKARESLKESPLYFLWRLKKQQ